MAKKPPTEKPKLSEQAAKIKSELSDKALDKVVGGILPPKYKCRVGCAG